MISSPGMCQLLRWSCRRKKSLPVFEARVRGWSGANFLMYSSDNQRESQHSYSTVDVSSKESGPDLGYMLYANQGIKPGGLRLWCTHTQIDNVDASFKYDVFVHVGRCYRTVLSMHYWTKTVSFVISLRVPRYSPKFPWIPSWRFFYGWREHVSNQQRYDGFKWT